MYFYEFTLIAQQGLIQQEVEGLVQELALLLKNIKEEILLQQVGSVAESNKQLDSTRIQEMLISYSDILENIIKILWIELEKDFSNFKEIKVKIDNMLDTWQLQEIKELPTKGAFICSVVNDFRKNMSEFILQNFQIDKLREYLLKDIEASGLIKYEYWGLQDFAYPINKIKSGHYCILCIGSTPSIMNEFIRKVKLNENIIRYLSIRVDKIFEGMSHMLSKQQIEEQL